MDVFERAVDHWKSRSVPLRPPASEAEIEDTFAALDFPLTDDVRHWYLLADGFVEYYMDECDFCWWSLERIREENQDPHREKGYVWFADLLISSHLYCFSSTDEKYTSVWEDHDHPWHGSTGGWLDWIFTSWDRFLFKLRYGPLGPIDDGPRFTKVADRVEQFVEKLLLSPDDVYSAIIT